YWVKYFHLLACALISTLFLHDALPIYLQNNWYDRFTLRSTNNFMLLERLAVQLGVSYSNSIVTNNNNGLIGIRPNSSDIYPYARLADDQGTPLPIPHRYRQTFIDTVSSELLDWRYFPLNEIKDRENSNSTENIVINASAQYELIPGLKAAVLYQFERQNAIERDLQSDKLFYTRDLINRFTILEDGDATYNIPLGGILDQGHNQLTSHNIRGQLSYSNRFGSDHYLRLLAGAELRDVSIIDKSNRWYGYDDDMRTTTRVDYVTRFPQYAALGPAQTIVFNDFASLASNRFVSVYANGSYSYREKYTVSASARRDASNLFGVATNNKWKPLWSAGLRWDL